MSLWEWLKLINWTFLKFTLQNSHRRTLQVNRIPTKHSYIPGSVQATRAQSLEKSQTELQRPVSPESRERCDTIPRVTAGVILTRILLVDKHNLGQSEYPL